MCGGQTYFFSKILSLNPQVYTRLIAAMRLVSDYNEVVAAMRSPRFLFTELSHMVQERAEGPKAPSPGHRPGYNGNQ